MSDFVIGLIRTWVPILVGSLVSFLLTLGVELGAEAEAGLIVGVTGLLIGVYYTVVRLVAEKFPWAGALLGVNIAPKYNEG